MIGRKCVHSRAGYMKIRQMAGNSLRVTRTNMVPTFAMCKFHNPYCLSIVQRPIKRINVSEELWTWKKVKLTTRVPGFRKACNFWFSSRRMLSSRTARSWSFLCLTLSWRQRATRTRQKIDINWTRMPLPLGACWSAFWNRQSLKFESSSDAGVHHRHHQISRWFRLKPEPASSEVVFVVVVGVCHSVLQLMVMFALLSRSRQNRGIDSLFCIYDESSADLVWVLKNWILELCFEHAWQALVEQEKETNQLKFLLRTKQLAPKLDATLLLRIRRICESGSLRTPNILCAYIQLGSTTTSSSSRLRACWIVTRTCPRACSLQLTPPALSRNSIT